MIFCVCGGILEVGLIAAFLGWVSRVVFKRKAKKPKCKHTEVLRAGDPFADISMSSVVSIDLDKDLD